MLPETCYHIIECFPLMRTQLERLGPIAQVFRFLAGQVRLVEMLA